MLLLSRVGASDLRSLVGWLEKGVRGGEGERQGEIGGKDGKILGKLGGVFFASTQSWCMRRRRKIAKSFGSGAGFLFVQTRHAQSPKITAHSTQPEPSVSRTRAAAEERRGVFLKGRAEQPMRCLEFYKRGPSGSGGRKGNKRAFCSYRWPLIPICASLADKERDKTHCCHAYKQALPACSTYWNLEVLHEVQRRAKRSRFITSWTGN